MIQHQGMYLAVTADRSMRSFAGVIFGTWLKISFSLFVHAFVDFIFSFEKSSVTFRVLWRINL